MRRLACIKCGQTIRVREGIWFEGRFIERDWIDPELFVGGCCLEPKEQLELDEPFETRMYDPAIAEIPF